MEAVRQYEGHSEVGAAEGGGQLIHLFPDLAREPVYLRALVKRPLVFRDAMLALGRAIRSEHYVSRREIEERSLDPLITVSDERVWFEAFSRDESMYTRVRLEPAMLQRLGRCRAGCTNIQFSEWFGGGLRQLRSRSQVWLEVGRAGLAVADGRREMRRKEERIRLPDSWMQGFVEVQAAARLPAVVLDLHPRDLREVLVYLRSRRAKHSPRGLRLSLVPGEPPRVEVEPWGERFDLERSNHDSGEPGDVVVWGRRRLLLLLDVLPLARRVTARLMGTARPSFWTVLLRDASFTLGLSPWSSRDWTRKEAWQLFQPPAEVTEAELRQVRDQLDTIRTRDELQASGALDSATLDAALDELGLRGEVLFDPEDGAFLARSVFPGGTPPPSPLAARRERAAALVAQGRVTLARSDGDRSEGVVRGRGGDYEVVLRQSADGRLLGGSCGCAFFRRFSLMRGPCKHLLAAREVASGLREASKPLPE